MADSHSGPVETTSSSAWSWPRKASVLPKPSVPWKKPVRPRHQPSESTTSQVFSPGRQQGADVVGLHVQGRRVAGVTRGQLDVPHALAVEKCLVHAVRRRVEPRPRGAAASRKRCRRTWAARSVSCGSMKRAVQSEGSKRPVSNQAGSDQSLSTPSAQTLTRQTTCCREARGAPGQATRTLASESTRSETTTVDLEGIRLLRHRTRRQAPGKTGPAAPEPEKRRREMLDPEVGGRMHVGRC